MREIFANHRFRHFNRTGEIFSFQYYIVSRCGYRRMLCQCVVLDYIVRFLKTSGVYSRRQFYFSSTAKPVRPQINEYNDVSNNKSLLHYACYYILLIMSVARYNTIFRLSPGTFTNFFLALTLIGPCAYNK